MAFNLFLTSEYLIRHPVPCLYTPLKKMRKPLYCSPSGRAYYALAKVKGKQIRASFQTNFIAATTHKLKDKRR